MWRAVTWATTWTCAFVLPFPAVGQEHHVDLEKENQVRFLSDAPVEDFEGITERIDGYLLLPRDEAGNANLSGSQFYFEVDLASLDTGIGLRNRHMRDNYLETEEFPYAKYTGRVGQLVEESDGRFRAEMSGRFALHGVERERAIECSGEQIAASVRVRCEFEVRLTDHEISVPRLMFLKINEVIEVRVDFFLSPATAEVRGRV